MQVSGVATLAGTDRVQIDYGLYLDGTTQILLQAAGGVSGAFDDVTLNPSALMAAEHDVGANDVTVSFTRLATTTVTEAGTPKDTFAKWLDDQIEAGDLSPEMIDYIDTLLRQSTRPEAEALLGERTEPVQGAVQNNVAILDVGIAGNVFDRFASDHGAQCVQLVETSARAENCTWIRGLRQWGDGEGDRFGPRYDWTLNGVQVGIDHTTESGWTFGVSIGYGQTDTHDAYDGHNELRSKFGGVYANYARERFGMSAVALYGKHESETSRKATLGDSVRYARSEFDVDSVAAGVRLGYRLTDQDRVVVRPFVDAFYDRIGDVAIAEQGAPGRIQAYVHEREGLRGTLGVQFANTCEGRGLVFRPSLDIGVVHQFLDAQSTLDVQPFADGTSFRAYGVRGDRTSYRANAALGISLGDNATMSIGYGGELASDRSLHEVAFGFRVVW